MSSGYAHGSFTKTYFLDNIYGSLTKSQLIPEFQKKVNEKPIVQHTVLIPIPTITALILRPILKEKENKTKIEETKNNQNESKNNEIKLTETTITENPTIETTTTETSTTETPTTETTTIILSFNKENNITQNSLEINNPEIIEPTSTISYALDMESLNSTKEDLNPYLKDINEVTLNTNKTNENAFKQNETLEFRLNDESEYENKTEENLENLSNKEVLPIIFNQEEKPLKQKKRFSKNIDLMRNSNSNEENLANTSKTNNKEKDLEGCGTFIIGKYENGSDIFIVKPCEPQSKKYNLVHSKILSVEQRLKSNIKIGSNDLTDYWQSKDFVSTTDMPYAYEFSTKWYSKKSFIDSKSKEDENDLNNDRNKSSKNL